MARAKRILLYGTVPSNAPEFEQFVRDQLNLGNHFVTRNGTSRDPGHADASAWGGGVAGHVPADDVVIDACAAWAAENGRHVGEVLTTWATRKGRTDARAFSRDVGQNFHTTAEERIPMYDQLLNASDAVIFVGGSDGVLRLAMMVLGTSRPMLVLGAYGGTSAEVASVSAALTKPKEMWRCFTHDQALDMAGTRLSAEQLSGLLDVAFSFEVMRYLRAFFAGDLKASVLGKRLFHAVDATVQRAASSLLVVLCVLVVVLYLLDAVGGILGLVRRILGSG